MKKHTLIENIKLDPHTYLVTIGTDMGQFSGAVECREEDWGYESRFFGFELAEVKAEIQYARAKKNYYAAQLDALVRFWREMAETRTYNVDAFWVKKMRKSVDEVTEQKNYWAFMTRHMKQRYHEMIVEFDAQKAVRDKVRGKKHD